MPLEALNGLEDIEEDSEEAKISVKVILVGKDNPGSIWRTGQTLEWGWGGSTMEDLSYGWNHRGLPYLSQ